MVLSAALFVSSAPPSSAPAQGERSHDAVGLSSGDAEVQSNAVISNCRTRSQHGLFRPY